ncbi:MAG: hypothetical protein DHS20C02_09460 [Micavibrio sp.]|nr:MAG: hypothetical protein DHS20C02_09460 [Micavibrio sp.]
MEKLLIQKMALERCKNDLAHLCALMHLSNPDNLNTTRLGGEAVLHLITSMTEELDVIEGGLDALAETYSGQ